MKLWSALFDENDLTNYPKLVYKNRIMTHSEQSFLTSKLFNIFSLTHRDRAREINNIKKISDELPYKKLYNLFLDDDPFEFETEYMVFLLNYFKIEID